MSKSRKPWMPHFGANDYVEPYPSLKDQDNLVDFRGTYKYPASRKVEKRDDEETNLSIWRKHAETEDDDPDNYYK